MKSTVVSPSVLIGNFQPGIVLHPTPVNPGVNVGFEHPLSQPVPPSPSPSPRASYD